MKQEKQKERTHNYTLILKLNPFNFCFKYNLLHLNDEEPCNMSILNDGPNLRACSNFLNET